MPTRKERAQETLTKLVDAFDSGELAAQLATITRIKRDPNDDAPPSARWSMTNNLLMILSGTDDARGIRQWNKAGRKVRKGARAFYILAPRTVKKEKAKAELFDAEITDAGPDTICIGFFGVPVFRLEDTEGAEIPRFNYTPPEPPPLAEVAAAMNISVEYVPANPSSGNGYYVKSDYTAPRITLMTHEARTFFHELAHAAHDAIGLLRGRQKWQREIVAELSAAVIGEMYGQRDRLEHSAAYLETHAPKGHDIGRACASVLADVEKVLNFIWDKADALAVA